MSVLHVPLDGTEHVAPLGPLYINLVAWYLGHLGRFLRSFRRCRAAWYLGQRMPISGISEARNEIIE